MPPRRGTEIREAEALTLLNGRFIRDQRGLLNALFPRAQDRYRHVLGSGAFEVINATLRGRTTSRKTRPAR